jgi:hypothetical protein
MFASENCILMQHERQMKLDPCFIVSFQFSNIFFHFLIPGKKSFQNSSKSVSLIYILKPFWNSKTQNN